MQATPRCRHCGEVIGTYEPTVLLSDGHPRRTSRASEPEAEWAREQCFHEHCYAASEEDAG